MHFTKNSCWRSKDDGKELDMIRSGGLTVLRGIQTFKIVVEGSKHTGTQSDDSSGSRASSTGKGTRHVRSPGSRCRRHAGRSDGETAVPIRGPHGPGDAFS